MRTPITRLASASAIGAVMLGLAAIPVSSMAAHDEEHATIQEQGKELAFDRRKGNCLACHAIPDGVSPGNIGPPLIVMNKRFASKEALRAQIWDATKANPDTIMPPFGRHMILTEDEINKITEFVWEL